VRLQSGNHGQPVIVVLVGIPGSGKSTLAKGKYSDYRRINLDTIKSRRQEEFHIAQALQNCENIVIDNTNSTIKARKKYIDIARRNGAKVIALYLPCPIELALKRNAKRKGKERVPDFVVRIYNKKLEIPSVSEGFDSVIVADNTHSSLDA
jgi:predicted kinase